MLAETYLKQTGVKAPPIYIRSLEFSSPNVQYAFERHTIVMEIINNTNTFPFLWRTLNPILTNTYSQWLWQRWLLLLCSDMLSCCSLTFAYLNWILSCFRSFCHFWILLLWISLSSTETCPRPDSHSLTVKLIKVVLRSCLIYRLCLPTRWRHDASLVLCHHLIDFKLGATLKYLPYYLNEKVQ